jgi:hypothetical protein
MANAPKMIRKSAKLQVRAAKEEMKNPKVTGKGSGLQTKATKAFMKTEKVDSKGYAGKKVGKALSKADSKKK